MTDQYAVMGNPIAHSKSPRIHTEFARQTGQHLEYRAMLVELDSFAEAVDDFRQRGGRGLNITVPFKQQAWQLASRRTGRAQRAGAANTLWFEQEQIQADNTDGAGLVTDLQANHGCQLKGRRILLLGAGGAARGVLAPLLEAGPDKLVIANRTASRARDLAAEYPSSGRLEGGGFDTLGAETSFDLIVNATAASLGGEVPSLPHGIVAPGGWCYDMMYGAEPTAFLNWSQTQGVEHRLDGLGMLVEQAAESFYLWRGMRPKTAGVIGQLRAELS